MALLDSIVRNAVSVAGKVIGFPAVLRREEMKFNIETDSTAAQITDYPVQLLPLEGYSASQIDGEKIQQKDLKISMISVGAPEPTPETDKLIFGEKQYRIITVGFVSAGELPALYVLQCRK